jgi:hypothetical protein
MAKGHIEITSEKRLGFLPFLNLDVIGSNLGALSGSECTESLKSA